MKYEKLKKTELIKLVKYEQGMTAKLEKTVQKVQDKAEQNFDKLHKAERRQNTIYKEIEKYSKNLGLENSADDLIKACLNWKNEIDGVN